MKSTGQIKMGRLEISTMIVSRNQAQTVNNTYSILTWFMLLFLY